MSKSGTPITDAASKHEFDAVPPHDWVAADDARALELALAAAEKRALECVAINERQAVNFAKCQAELAAERERADMNYDHCKRAEEALAALRAGKADVPTGKDGP